MQLTNDELMFSEVYSFLNLIGNEYINKIPRKLFEYIKNQSKMNIEFDKNKDMDLQLSEDSISFIAYLNLKYWVDDVEKERLIKLYKQNDANDEKIKIEKYSYKNIFENRNNYIYTNNKNEELTITTEKNLVDYSNQSFYKKLLNKIKLFFRKINSWL